MWIKPVEVPPDILGRTRSGFPQVYATPVPAVGNESIVLSHSPIPEALEHSFSALAAMYAPHLPLTRSQQEMIATVVSVHNRCVY